MQTLPPPKKKQNHKTNQNQTKYLYPKSESVWKQTGKRIISRKLNFFIFSLYETVYMNKRLSSYIFINNELKYGNIINTNQDEFTGKASQLTWWD